jgi:hypothetical protein
MPDVAQFSAPEIVREIVKHLGGALTETEIRRWLAENFARFNASLAAVAQRQRQQMLAGMDAQWGAAGYELQAPLAQCRKQLDALAEGEPDDLADQERNGGFVEARDWFDASLNAKQLAAPGGQVLLGRVLLGPSRWRLKTVGAEKLSRLRRQFEVQMDRLVRFSSERVDDLGTRLTLQEPAGDQALVPPCLMKNPAQFQLATSRVAALSPNVSPADAPPWRPPPKPQSDRDEDLEQTFRSNLQQMVFCIQDETPKKLEAFLKSSPQPDLILALMGEFMETIHQAPQKFRPSLNPQPVILALLKSVMDQLDAALGRK